MFCNQCGHENRNDRKFCENCGAKLTDYTKPRENLIMPEEIAEKQAIVKKKNNTAKVFNISLTVILVMGVVLVASTFFAPKTVANVVSIVCVSLFVVFIIVWIIKYIILHRLTKQQHKMDK